VHLGRCKEQFEPNIKQPVRRRFHLQVKNQM
jgi:hypothetical protein